MVDYAETYKINGQNYGIEDYSRPGDHFMPSEPHKRFRLWRSGCGIGQADNISKAREMLHSYALAQALAEYSDHKQRMEAAGHVVTKLGGDPFNLGKFLQCSKS